MKLAAVLALGLCAGTAMAQVGGGVTQILAGTGVTVSPANGTGTVTVNSTGGGGGATLPYPGIVYATSGTAGTVATAAQVVSTITPPPSGATAEWDLVNCTTTCVDATGNGHTATLGTSTQAPTIGSFGALFNAQLYTAPTYISTTLTTYRSVLVHYCTDNTVFNATLTNFPAAQYPTLWGPSTASGGVGFYGAATYGAYQLAPQLASIAEGVAFGTQIADQFGNCHVAALVTQTSGNDSIYVDGNLVTNLYTNTNTGASVTTTGVYQIGCSTQGLTCSSSGDGWQGYINEVMVYPTVLTATQVQQATTYLQAKMNALPGFQAYMATVTNGTSSAANQVLLVGDDLTAAEHNTSGTWQSHLGFTNTYNVQNWVYSGTTLHDQCAMAATRFITGNAPHNKNYYHVWGGTNDSVVGSYPAPVPQNTWNTAAGCAAAIRAVGGIPIFSTMIDRTGQSSFAQSFNALARAGWQAAGFAALSDLAESPNLSPNGTNNTNATYYYTDNIHLSGTSTCTGTTGYGIVCLYVSNIINMLDGTTASNPQTLTAATANIGVNRYTIATPTAAQTLTLPDCSGMTGQVYQITNTQSTYTVTVNAANTYAGTAVTINGSTTATVPANTTSRFLDVLVSPSAGGCNWVIN